MLVRCETCEIEYDDVYRLTYCPHESFEMRCRVVVNGEERIATSVEQLRGWLDEKKTP